MRVDLLLSDHKFYTYEGVVAREVAHILERFGIELQTYYLCDGFMRSYLLDIANNPPDWTLSFTNLIPYQKPLCDMLFTPHFYWLEDSLGLNYHYLQSDYGFLGLPNAALSKKLQDKRVLFLPHGVRLQKGEKKRFEVVLFADLIELSFLKRTWQELVNREGIEKIYKGIESDEPLLSENYFFYAEQYLKAEKIAKQVVKFKEFELHVFGEHAGNNWLVRLPKTVYLHTLLPYSEYFEVLKMSKICIAEVDSFWYLPAIANECLPLPADEKMIAYYLRHPEDRERELENLKKHVVEHTWEKQVSRLIEYIKNESKRYHTYSR